MKSFWEPCWACRVVAGETFGCFVSETRDVLVLLNPFPSAPGHALVVPRRHVRDLYELPDELAGPILSTAARVARAAKLAFEADGVTLRQNNEAASDQHLFHFHLHVIPRFEGDRARFDATPTRAGREEQEAEAARLRQALAVESGGRTAARVTKAPDIRIRPARAEDREFILSLLPRLSEFGPPPWRDAARMAAADLRALSDALSLRPHGTDLFVAEDARGHGLGFIHLRPSTDYYEQAEHGHIADLVVAPAAEGRGVARALLETAEEWARARGYGRLTLSVFAQNLRARELYRRAGYGEDVMKYVKELA